MAREKLSDTAIGKVRLPAGKNEIVLADGDGLYLRVRRAADGRSVVRQWQFVSKAGGRATKVGLGGLDDVPLALARQKADALRQRRDAGGLVTRVAADTALRTLGDLFEHLERVRPNETTERRGLWDRHCARLADVRLDALNRRHIVSVLDGIVLDGRRNLATGGRHDKLRTAGAVFGLLRLLCSFGVGRGVLTADPMSGMKRKDFGHQGKVRERVLSADEIKELSRRFAVDLRVGPKGREFDIPPLHPGAQAAVWFLLATCVRVGELAAMTPAQVDRKAATWTVPATVAKNRREHVVHLSPFALRMLDAMRRLPTAPGVTNCGATLAKMLHGRQQAAGAQQRRAASTVLLLPGGPFTPHDLRRTGASMMGELGTRSEVIERALNHTLPGLQKVYQRQDLMTERRAAFDALGAQLTQLVDTTGVDKALARAAK
jgi:integrase